jgi:hypothetical protein
MELQLVGHLPIVLVLTDGKVLEVEVVDYCGRLWLAPFWRQVDGGQRPTRIIDTADLDLHHHGENWKATRFLPLSLLEGRMPAVDAPRGITVIDDPPIFRPNSHDRDLG